MRTMIFIFLLACLWTHISLGQNLENKKGDELRFDDYKFDQYPFYPNFSLDSTWINPETMLHARRDRKEVESRASREVLSQRYLYLKNNRIPDSARTNMYFPFDRMPCLYPYGLYRMNVLEVDPGLHNMPVK